MKIFFDQDTIKALVELYENTEQYQKMTENILAAMEPYQQKIINDILEKIRIEVEPFRDFDNRSHLQ